jgi:hypothetical protein
MPEYSVDKWEHSVIWFRHFMNITTTEVAAEPEFATLPNTQRLMGVSRTRLYGLEAEGIVRFIRIRKPGNIRGRVLVDLGSVRRYLNECAGAAKEKGSTE